MGTEEDLQGYIKKVFGDYVAIYHKLQVETTSSPGQLHRATQFVMEEARYAEQTEQDHRFGVTPCCSQGMNTPNTVEVGQELKSAQEDN